MEFALVIPAALALILCVLHMSFIVYGAVTLHFATEEEARCLSVSANNPPTATTSCPNTDATSVQTYGARMYQGPSINPTFSLGASAACTNGKQVTATGTYNMAMGVATIPFSLSAKSCFPYNYTS